MPDDDRLDDVLDALRAEIDDTEFPVSTAPAVAERLGRERRRVHDDLTVLERAGEVASMPIGARGRVWCPDPHPWRERAVAPRERAQERAQPERDRAPDDAPERDQADGGDGSDAIADALAGWSHGRGAQERDASETVARRSLEWLRDTTVDEPSRGDVPLEELVDADPLDRDPDTIWTEIVRDAWQHAAERGFIDQPHSRAYRWVGR